MAANKKLARNRQLCLMLLLENAHDSISKFSDFELQQRTIQEVEKVGIIKADQISIEFIEGDFSFDEIKNKPFKMLLTPVNYEFYYCSEKNVCTVRMRTSLAYFDGVSVLQTCFNILEYLEHNRSDMFTKSVKIKASAYQLKYFLNCAKWIYKSLLIYIQECWAQHTKCTYKSSSGPLFAFSQNNNSTIAKCLLYDIDEKHSFSTIVDTIDMIRVNLGFKGYICTFNFAPYVAISQISTVKDLLNKQARINGILFPPIAPKFYTSEILFFFSSYCFFNNYGRWSPNISSQVTKVYWDWIDFPKAHPLVVFSITVNNKCYVCLRSVDSNIPVIENYMASLGKPIRLNAIHSTFTENI